MADKEKNYFEVLNAVNVTAKTEKKDKLTYLSWAWAWGEVKKIHPDTTCKVYERDDGRIYWDDGRTAWVKVSTTINGLEHVEYLPVMDFRNASIPVDKITSFDANKAIQRALTKSIARHGLGLYIYAGEDLPEQEPTKTPEGVLIDWIAKIESSETVEALKKNYYAAHDAVKGDDQALDAILRAKDETKKKINKPTGP